MNQTPPREIEAERAVLGSIMLEEDVAVEVEGLISANDFYSTKHSEIYQIMQELYDNETPIDMVTVNNKIKDKGLQEDISATYITKLADSTPTAANAKHYAKLIRNSSKKRKAIKLGQKIKDLGYSDKDSNQIIEEAEEMMTTLQSDSNDDKVFKFSDTLPSYVDELEERKNSDGLVGLPWKWDSLNEMTGGIKKQNLTIVAARPSMGKTAFAIDTIKESAKKGYSAGVFSLEMSDFELKDRIFASETNINGLDLARGTFREDDWKRISHAAGELDELPIYMSSPELTSLSEIKAEARKLKRKNDIEILVVDYLQLVTGVEDNTRNLEVAEISRTFKQLARKLDIAVVLLAQLSRAVEQRSDKHPMLSDLRNSGGIEQDADLVCFLYRDEYYNPDTDKEGIIEVDIGKQRNGPTGSVDLVFLKEYQRIQELSRRGNSA